jgi:hypothetical protein
MYDKGGGAMPSPFLRLYARVMLGVAFHHRIASKPKDGIDLNYNNIYLWFWKINSNFAVIREIILTQS